MLFKYCSSLSDTFFPENSFVCHYHGNIMNCSLFYQSKAVKIQYDAWITTQKKFILKA